MNSTRKKEASTNGASVRLPVTKTDSRGKKMTNESSREKIESYDTNLEIIKEHQKIKYSLSDIQGLLAETDPKQKMVNALNGCLSAMQMKEEREAHPDYIPPQIMKHSWDKAIKEARILLDEAREN